MTTPAIRMAPGLYPDLPEDVYHADPCPEPSLSAGTAHKLLTATPLHAWADSRRLNPDWQPTDTSIFDIGRAAHAALTGVGGDIARVEADNWTTKAAKQARDDARAAGKTPLLAHQHDAVRRMVAAARMQLRQALGMDPFEAGICEASALWIAGGSWNRARPDAHLPDERVAYDYKTAGKLAAPDAWVRQSYPLGIDVRAAHYIEALDSLLPGDTPWRYRFVVQEKDPPHALSVIELAPHAIEVGREKLAHARRIWRECIEADRWPAWPAGVCLVDAPMWEVSRWQERIDREEATRAATETGRITDSGIQFTPTKRTAA